MPTECVGEKIWRPSAPPRQRYKGQRWACCGRRHSPEQNPRWTIQAPRKRGSGLKNYDSQKALGLSANDSQVPVRRRYGGKTLFPETVGLQLPAILAVASLAPPTAPRVLHASPVRVLCAPAQKQVSSVGIPYQDVYSNLSQIHPLDISDEDLPNCPIISPYINGPLKVLIPENLTMEQVVEKNPLVELGGQYRPPDCWTEQHTAVVVPYCGQGRQLQQLLFHLHPFLQRQQLHYAVYVVNQVNNSPFNRGKLCNVGFWEAMQEEDWDCVFFHDVNLLPEDDCNRYVCDVFPAHVSVAIDKFNYKLPYQGYLGGVFALRPIHYLRINGFPNTYWGWDQEDNEIAARVKLSGMLLSRPHLLFGRYHMLEEGQYPSHKQSPQSPSCVSFQPWPSGPDLPQVVAR
ncbi:beta-1,4-galactosyltransferase 3 isoform X5 [Vicugna pacos]|uniref:Beta-1,4-galactosyltransferase n=1 Tax=Vicugna pacos TaxID=30538 RepID=A0ABM5DUV3_VICPA